MPKTTKRSHKSEEDDEIGGGFLSGLTNLIEKLGELAEKGKELHGLKEFGTDEVKAVYGFTIRTNLRGSESGRGVKLEPSATFAPTRRPAAQPFTKSSSPRRYL